MQMGLFVTTAVGPCDTDELNTSEIPTVAQSALSKSTLKRAAYVSSQLSKIRALIEIENEGLQDEHLEPSDDHDFEEERRVGAAVLGRAIGDLMELQISTADRTSAYRFIFSKRKEYSDLRNCWCYWAGVHPEQVQRRTARMVQDKINRPSHIA